MATSPAEEVSSEDEIFFGEITMKEIRARFLPKEKRRELRHANRKKNMERNGSDTSIKIIEMHSEPEMNIENDWSDSSYRTTTSKKADHNIDAENSYLRLSPDDSFLKLEKHVANCSLSDDIFQNHISGIKFCFDPSSNKLPMTADENVKQVAKIEQNHLFYNNNRDGLFQLEQGKPEIQGHDDTPPHKQNPPTDVNTNQVKPDVPRQLESAKSERTPLKNNNFLEPPIADVISTPRGNVNNTDNFKTPKNTVSKKQQTSSVTRSLKKVNAYQHVASPVALYIKRSPQAPLVHSVNPKPLITSHIPKLKKKPVKKISDKENTPMPKTVYRTPKETVVITHDRKNISEDQHSNIKASTSVVIRKHAPSEGKLKESKKIVFEDDTINESLISQPDLSIHIEKSALY